MLDRLVLHSTRRSLHHLASRLTEAGVQADQVTWAGFVVGISAVPLIITQHYALAVACILLNRLADGLDGTIARLTAPTDRGAFLDIVFDFLFYSAIPLAFALAEPQQNALAAAVLIYSFIGTGCSFLAFAVLAAKRKLKSSAYPNKGFYYLGGFTEASETIFVFVVMCLFPHWFAQLAYGYAALCMLTVATRIAAGVQVFKTG